MFRLDPNATESESTRIASKLKAFVLEIGSVIIMIRVVCFAATLVIYSKSMQWGIISRNCVIGFGLIQYYSIRPCSLNKPADEKRIKGEGSVSQRKNTLV